MRCPGVCNGCGEVVELHECKGAQMLCAECCELVEAAVEEDSNE